MAEEQGYSRVSPGVYVNRKGEVKIKLRDASDDAGNGVNLAPDTEAISSSTSLAITAAAWRRINKAIEERKSGI